MHCVSALHYQVPIGEWACALVLACGIVHEALWEPQFSLWPVDVLIKECKFEPDCIRLLFESGLVVVPHCACELS